MIPNSRKNKLGPNEGHAHYFRRTDSTLTFFEVVKAVDNSADGSGIIQNKKNEMIFKIQSCYSNAIYLFIQTLSWSFVT